MLIDWPRSRRMTRSGACATSTPVTVSEPAMRSRAVGSSRITAFAMVVLPEPLSPISAKNSPRGDAEAHVVDNLELAPAP